MGKFDEVLLKSETFFKQCIATIRSDMANRIMYSVLPSVVNKSQSESMEGILDPTALDAAIYGRKDIIKHGAMSCFKELYHYNGDKYSMLDACKDAFYKQNYQDFFDFAITLFEDKKGFDNYFGGFAWSKIAKSLLRITILDKNLDIIKASRGKDPEAYNKENNIKKQLILELNVFDGLAHNTDSILKNLIQNETEELRDYFTKNNPNDKIDDAIINRNINEYGKIRDLMDAKELANPIHVFKEIEPTLKGSGDLIRYKEHATKLRNHPDYINSNKDYLNELLLIRFKKANYEYYNKILELIRKIELNEDIIINMRKINEYAQTIKHSFNYMSKEQKDDKLIKLRAIIQQKSNSLEHITNNYTSKTEQDRDPNKLSEYIQAAKSFIATLDIIF